AHPSDRGQGAEEAPPPEPQRAAAQLPDGRLKRLSCGAASAKAKGPALRATPGPAVLPDLDAGLAEGVDELAQQFGEPRMAGLELHCQGFQPRGMGGCRSQGRRARVRAGCERALDVAHHGAEQLARLAVDRTADAQALVQAREQLPQALLSHRRRIPNSPDRWTR